MAVVSVRFNEEESKILDILKKHYNCDSSSLIKRSLWDYYEEIKDKEIIEEFEEKEKSSKSAYIKIEDII